MRPGGKEGCHLVPRMIPWGVAPCDAVVWRRGILAACAPVGSGTRLIP